MNGIPEHGCPWCRIAEPKRRFATALLASLLIHCLLVATLIKAAAPGGEAKAPTVHVIELSEIVLIAPAHPNTNTREI